MLNTIKKNMYKKMNGHIADAEALLPVLGNKERILQVVADKDIEGGKWELIFEEMYTMLEKDDAKILKDFYFDIVKREEIDILWEGFAHHEAQRQKVKKERQEIEKDALIDNIIIQASDNGMEIEELVYKLYSRMQDFQNKQIPQQETQVQNEPEVEVVEEVEVIVETKKQPILVKEEVVEEVKPVVEDKQLTAEQQAEMDSFMKNIPPADEEREAM